MSQLTVPLNTGQQATINTDTSKIFVWKNRYETDNYVNNSTYNPITLVAGTIMGRVSATGVLIPWTSTASDGSQWVVGILANDLQLAAGALVQAPICISGDVVANQLVFTLPGDAMETVVAGRRAHDKIQGETAGIILLANTEMSDFDNQ